MARGNAGDRADYVPARALDWDVPKVERLWFGDDAEDKKIRLKVKEMTILKGGVANLGTMIWVTQFYATCRKDEILKII